MESQAEMIGDARGDVLRKKIICNHEAELLRESCISSYRRLEFLDKKKKKAPRECFNVNQTNIKWFENKLKVVT